MSAADNTADARDPEPAPRAHLQAAQLIGDASDPYEPAGPGWLASRTWWFLVGMAWGGVLVAIALRVGAEVGR